MTLREAIEQYVLWRQAHGAKFTTARNLLRQFLGHSDGDAGWRFSEATGLTRADVDLSESILTIRDTKFYKSRLVPVGSQLAAVLATYMSARPDDGIAQREAAFLLANRDGTRLASSTVQTT